MDQIASLHKSVLLKEVVKMMNLESANVIVDGTLGLGGYSEAVLNENKKVQIVAFDLDKANLAKAKNRLAQFEDRMTYIEGNFADIKASLTERGIATVDGIMLDLGLASTQVDDGERGFSFNKEADLDMRFDRDQAMKASDVLNTYSLDQLVKVFREYGEERSAYKLATAIVKRRKDKNFESTIELADFITDIKGKGKGKIHPATQVFQALRIEVNKEMENLKNVLQDSVDMLASQARIVVVSYHSLEDRIVKNFFRDQSKSYVNIPDRLETTYLDPKLKIITKKPISPTTEEIAANPRSRSAKLRVAEKL